MERKKIAEKVRVAKKYKINRPSTFNKVGDVVNIYSSASMLQELRHAEPYAKVEFIHPRSGKHEVVEFTADGSIERATHEIYFERKTGSPTGFFIAGMLWAGAIASLLWVIFRF